MYASQSGGSCEPCKKRKCKCDKKQPNCTPCSASPSSCRYAESNKRGIPAGYLNALEQRLNETENILYGALRELQNIESQSGISYSMSSLHSSELSTRPAVSNKIARMTEWTSLPLKNADDVELWRHTMAKDDMINEHNVYQQGYMTSDSTMADQEQQQQQQPPLYAFDDMGNASSQRAKSLSPNFNNTQDMQIQNPSLFSITNERSQTSPLSDTHMLGQHMSDPNVSISDLHTRKSTMPPTFIYPSNPQRSPTLSRSTEDGLEPQQPSLTQAKQLTQSMAHLYY